MNLNTLNDFRHGMYKCFGNGKDALFNLVDALSSEARARSFPELSLSPFFERSWASLYEALRYTSKGKEPIMSNQPENPIPAQELREALLVEIEARQQAIVELSDEQLEEVAGGSALGKANRALHWLYRGTADVLTLGTAEIYWHTKSGKKHWKELQNQIP
jgi:hypothetical protein